MSVEPNTRSARSIVLIVLIGCAALVAAVGWFFVNVLVGAGAID